MIAGNSGMDIYEAARILDRAFPKHPVFVKTDPNVSVIDLMDALFVAKKRCNSYCLGDCIEWGREVMKSK